MLSFKKWIFVVIVLLPLTLLLVELKNSFEIINGLPLKELDLSLDTEYSYFIDQESELHIEDIALKSNSFIPSHINEADSKFGDFTYWHKLSIRNVKSGSRDIVLMFDNPMLDRISIYKRKGEGYTKITELGDKVFGLPKELAALPKVSLAIGSNETTEILIRSQTVGPPALALAIFNKEEFERYKNVVYLIWGAFIGVVLLMALYNLILYIGVSEKTYLLYIGYIITFLLELGEVHGYNVYLMSEPIHQFLSKNVISLNYLIGYFTLLFALHFFRFDQEKDRLITKIAYGYANVILLFSVLSLAVVEYIAAQIYFVMLISMYVITLTIMTIRLKQNVVWAKFYVISWFPLFVGAAVGPLMLTGNLEYSFWTRHALLLGVMFEMTFISMALAERLRVSESERLYEASHDHVFGFANSSLLETKAREVSGDNTLANFSMVIVAIEKYDSIVPYLSAENLKKLVFQFIFDVEEYLDSRLLLIEIDKKSKFSRAVMIREGVFGFIVSSNDDALIRKALDDFALKQPLNYRLDDLSISLNCILGAAANSEKVNDPHELLNQAQQAIDSAIENNKNYWVYSFASKSEEGRRVRLASDLQHAIGNNTLELYHQPQVCIDSGEVIGTEVLLRWNHPILGPISPDEFVTIAENTGLINRLSQWVFTTACSQLRRMMDTGLKGHRLSVNFSAYDVMLENFVTQLIEKITEYDLKPEYFTLELTETVSVNDSKRFNSNLIELKELGFHIAMDDFGTGYSSLTYVSRHPFDELKIDREFVMDLDRSEKHQLIVKATIKMANSLGLKVVAEGVENQASFVLLKQYGCDIAQGFLLAKPLSLPDFLDWLDEHNIKQAM